MEVKQEEGTSLFLISIWTSIQICTDVPELSFPLSERTMAEDENEANVKVKANVEKSKSHMQLSQPRPVS
jgi:hypothetical protein